MMVVAPRKQYATKGYVVKKRQGKGAYYSMRQWPRAPLASRGFWGSSVRSRDELKVVDTATAGYACDSTGSITLINGVATGTDFTNRIGRKVVMKSVLLQGFVFPVDQQAGDNAVRIMIVYDSQPNGTAPAMTDIFTAADGISPMNLNNRDRFRVIADIRKVVAYLNNTATQAVAGGPTIHAIKAFRKLNHEVIFGGTGATVGSIQTGALWLVTLGFQSAASTLGSLSELSVRVRFVDA